VKIKKKTKQTKKTQHMPFYEHSIFSFAQKSLPILPPFQKT